MSKKGPSKVRKLKFPIRPILEHYGATVPSGASGRRKMKCPFHADAHASASVDLGPDQRFRCFGCAVAGDALDILRVQEGDSLEAAIALAESITGESSQTVQPTSAPSPTLFDW